MAQLFDPVFLDSQSVLLVRFFADLSIKGVVILLVASGLTFAFRRASASARHLVWSLALTSLLALPALSLLLPAWQVAAFSRVMPSENLSTPLPAPVAPIIAPASDSIEPSSGGTRFEKIEGSGSKSLPMPGFAAESAGAGVAKGAGPASLRLPFWLMLIWLSGAAMLLARLLIGTASVRRTARNAERVTDPARVLMVRSISWQLGLKREVELLVSERISMPLTFGSLRSVVLLPSEAVLWDDERLQIVLLHELAHVKRKDCFTQLIAHLSCALHWFNPLAWLALREFRIERERACDDYVLDTGTKASDYASHLLEIARALGATECSSFATVAIARRSQLEGRLLAILDPSLSRKGLKRMPKLLIALALISVILPLAAIQPKAHAREARGDASPAQPGEGGAAQTIKNPAIPGLARAEAPSPKASPESPAAEPQPEPSPEPSISVEAGAEATAAQDNEQPAQQEERKDLSGIADALSEALNDADPEVRMNALTALARMKDPRAIDGLVQALKDPNPDIRDGALQGLAMMQNARSVEAVIEAVKDQSAQVREKAAWALGMQNDDRVIEPLIGALRDENWQVREKAAWALGLKGDRRAVEPLIAALNDPQPEVKHKAAWALGLKGDSRAVEPLIATLRDEKADVREVSAWALGLRGDKRAVSALEAATKDPNKEVRQKAYWALGLLLMRQGEGPEVPATNGDNDGDSPQMNLNLNTRLKMSNKINVKLKNVSNVKN